MIESNSNIASMYASNIQSGVSSLEGVNPAKKDGVSHMMEIQPLHIQLIIQ